MLYSHGSRTSIRVTCSPRSNFCFSSWTLMVKPMINGPPSDVILSSASWGCQRKGSKEGRKYGLERSASAGGAGHRHQRPGGGIGAHHHGDTGRGGPDCAKPG